jgi:hypothetical protein
VATVEASVGSTVEIPVYLTGVPSSGINNCDFVLWYEPSVIEVTSVDAGSIIANGDKDFSSHIHDDRGRLTFMFVDETGKGQRMIKTDGVFAVITAKVLSNAAAPITVANEGVFTDYDFKSISIKFVNGGVNLGSSVTPPPTQRPTQTPTPTPPKTPTPTQRPTATPQPASGNLKVEFYNSNRASSSSSIHPQFRLTNTGSSPINLSNVTLRYYYTIDGNQSQTFWCDHAAKTGNQYEAITSAVSGKFSSISGGTSNADYYVDISFSSSAGTLEANRPVEIQGRFAKNDWSNYNQSNDYSFNANASGYTEWDRVTAYINGQLVWGVEPGGSQPTVPPTQTPKPTVPPTQTPKPTATPTIPPGALVVDIATVSGKPGDTVEIPISFKNVPTS